jgi:hypothetical protein
METLQNEMTVELSTECDCTYFDENEVEIQVEYCSGECWTSEYEYFHSEFLPLWLKANSFVEDEIIRLEGSRMTWRNVSGYLDLEADKLVEALTIAGDFRLTFTLSSDHRTLKVRRGSHDEPMGAYFEVSKSEASKCAWCRNITICEVLDSDYPNELACVEHCLAFQRELAESRNK